MSHPKTKSPSAKRPQQRKGRTHLWGLPIAPTPRYPQKNETHTQHQDAENSDSSDKKAQGITRKASPPNKRSQGLALLMVLSLLVLATTLTLELQYDARVQLQMAANSRDALRAEYLAKSALEFTHLLLSFEHKFRKIKGTFKAGIKQLLGSRPEMAMLLNRFQLWSLVPVNSDLIKSIAGGAYGRAKRKEGDETKGRSSDQGQLYPFGDFSGRFSASLTDESAKINLNHFYNAREAAVLRKQLEAIFAPPRYNPLFENPRADGTRITRQEQISAIQDWIDPDNRVAGEASNSEDTKYRYDEKGYYTKNSYLDSVKELRLIYGVDDIFYQTFGHLFTVYGPLRINIQQADINILRGLVMAHGRPKPPFDQSIFLQPVFLQFIQAMDTWRNYIGFEDDNAFFNWCENPNILPSNLTQGLGATNLQQQINPQQLPRFTMARNTGITLTTDTDLFRVEAVGQVGRVQRRINAVIFMEPRGARKVYFWQLQ
ncbi:MAG: general secretion pathway protein GspK [Myxococcales bacterium]|nr:general secretion pathway protein GspK [Myxococcales bacterium]